MQAFYCSSHTFSLFCSGHFGEHLPGWPGTTILPTSASQGARIMGVSHWQPGSSDPSALAFQVVYAAIQALFFFFSTGFEFVLHSISRHSST
jgi:hypothetical protein